MKAEGGILYRRKDSASLKPLFSQNSLKEEGLSGKKKEKVSHSLSTLSLYSLLHSLLSGLLPPLPPPFSRLSLQRAAFQEAGKLSSALLSLIERLSCSLSAAKKISRLKILSGT